MEPLAVKGAVLLWDEIGWAYVSDRISGVRSIICRADEHIRGNRSYRPPANSTPNKKRPQPAASILT